MTHRGIRRQWPGLRAGTLVPDARERVRRHLRRCVECEADRRAEARFAATLAVLRTSPDGACDPLAHLDVRERVLADVVAGRTGRRSSRVRDAAGVVAVGAGLIAVSLVAFAQGLPEAIAAIRAGGGPLAAAGILAAELVGVLGALLRVPAQLLAGVLTALEAPFARLRGWLPALPILTASAYGTMLAIATSVVVRDWLRPVRTPEIP